MVSDVDSSSIARELNSGERLLWQGHPRGGIRLRAIDAYLIPFSLIWSGGVFFIAFGALTSARSGSGDLFALLPLLLFVVVGLYLLIGRFFADAMMRARTEYGLTSRRAIIVSGLFSRNIKSIDLRTTSEISLKERSDRSGTIIFGATPFGWWMQSNAWSFGSSSAMPAFEMIEDVRSVYNMVDQIRAGKA